MPVPTTIREPARIDDPFGRETEGAPPKTGRVRRAGGPEDYPALSASGAVAGIGDIIGAIIIDGITGDIIIGDIIICGIDGDIIIIGDIIICGIDGDIIIGDIVIGRKGDVIGDGVASAWGCAAIADIAGDGDAFIMNSIGVLGDADAFIMNSIGVVWCAKIIGGIICCAKIIGGHMG